MDWIVTIAAKAEKRVTRLPGQVQKALALLIADIEAGGRCAGTGRTIPGCPATGIIAT
jgi:hypothetical protein